MHVQWFTATLRHSTTVVKQSLFPAAVKVLFDSDDFGKNRNRRIKLCNINKKLYRTEKMPNSVDKSPRLVSDVVAEYTPAVNHIFFGCYRKSRHVNLRKM